MAKAIRMTGIVAFLVLVLGCGLLLAEGGAEGHGEAHGFNWVGFIGKVVDSTLLFGALIVFLRKPIIELLTQKSLAVKTDIITREEQVVTTTSQLDQIKKRLEKIEDEVTAMKQMATENGLAEQKRITELGLQESQHIVALSEAEINTRMENSIRNLKARIADLTIEHFKQEIEKQLDTTAHEKIIAKNIQISGDIIERE